MQRLSLSAFCARITLENARGGFATTLRHFAPVRLAGHARRSSCSCRRTSLSGGRFATGCCARRGRSASSSEAADCRRGRSCVGARAIGRHVMSRLEEPVAVEFEELRCDSNTTGRAGGLGKPQVQIGRRGRLASSGRTDDEFSAQQVGLDFVFKRVDRHIHGGGQRTRRRSARPRRRGSRSRGSGGLACRALRNRPLACRAHRERSRD